MLLYHRWPDLLLHIVSSATLSFPFISKFAKARDIVKFSNVIGAGSLIVVHAVEPALRCPLNYDHFWVVFPKITYTILCWAMAREKNHLRWFFFFFFLENFGNHAKSNIYLRFVLVLVIIQQKLHNIFMHRHFFHESAYIEECPTHRITGSRFLQLNLLRKNCIIFRSSHGKLEIRPFLYVNGLLFMTKYVRV